MKQVNARQSARDAGEARSGEGVGALLGCAELSSRSPCTVGGVFIEQRLVERACRRVLRLVWETVYSIH